MIWPEWSWRLCHCEWACKFSGVSPGASCRPLPGTGPSASRPRRSLAQTTSRPFGSKFTGHQTPKTSRNRVGRWTYRNRWKIPLLEGNPAGEGRPVLFPDRSSRIQRKDGSSSQRSHLPLRVIIEVLELQLRALSPLPIRWDITVRHTGRI